MLSRGCHLPSMCSLCNSTVESSFHLFFECTYVLNLWRWFVGTINCTLNFQTKEDVWDLCNNSWNPQCKIVLVATLINIFNGVWYARNQLRFQNTKIPWRATLDVSNFMLRKFSVKLHPPWAPQVIEVIWIPLSPNWIKCNTDGSTNSNQSSCGGIFKDSNSDFLLCFGENTGLGNALHAEIFGAIRAIELADSHNWKNLWLEVDSQFVLKNHSLVPWKLRNRWMNCIMLTSKMNFLARHIYREGNQCADTLASAGFNVPNLIVWLHLPDCISAFFVKDILGLPNFRFVTY